jgi:acetyl-CoA acetyltransferase
MSATLAQLRHVRVVGVGLHPYQRPGDTPYTALGVHAVRAALTDAGLEWNQVQAAYTGTATTAMGLSRLMYRHLGATGIPMAQVENASASGSTAFRQACIEVAAGLADVAIAVGVDKPLNFSSPQRAAGLHDLAGDRVVPFTHFALLAARYMHDHGVTPEQVAAVAVKNSRNGALNPHAQRRKARTLDEVPAPPRISGALTRLQCCPVGEGAAAVIAASDDAASTPRHAPRWPTWSASGRSASCTSYARTDASWRRAARAGGCPAAHPHCPQKIKGVAQCLPSNVPIGTCGPSPLSSSSACSPRPSFPLL